MNTPLLAVKPMAANTVAGGQTTITSVRNQNGSRDSLFRSISRKVLKRKSMGVFAANDLLRQYKIGNAYDANSATLDKRLRHDRCIRLNLCQMDGLLSP